MSQTVPPNFAEISLPDVFAFHKQLMLLSQAGVPLALESEPDCLDLETQLAKLASTIAIESASAPSLQMYFCESQSLPTAYVEAILDWHRSGGEVKSAEQLCRNGSRLAVSQKQIGNALFEPIALAFAGLIVLGLLVTLLVPWMEQIYEQTRERPDWSLRCLARLKPYLWTSMVPLFIILCWLVWFGRKSMLSRLLRADSKLRGQASKRSEPNFVGPLDTWMAKSNSRGETDSRFAKEVKRLATPDHRLQFSHMLPAVVSVFLGGAVVLTIGLCLFYPMVQLLFSIAKP